MTFPFTTAAVAFVLLLSTALGIGMVPTGQACTGRSRYFGGYETKCFGTAPFCSGRCPHGWREISRATTCDGDNECWSGRKVCCLKTSNREQAYENMGRIQAFTGAPIPVYYAPVPALQSPVTAFDAEYSRIPAGMPTRQFPESRTVHGAEYLGYQM